ncbi:MAG: thiamine pyrophosphate-dependent enzyme [Nitrososphaeraceae archaeon]
MYSPSTCLITNGLKLIITVVIWFDGDVGIISLKQSIEFGRITFTRFTNPDFVKLVESFGAVRYKIKSTQEFQTILKKARDFVSVPVLLLLMWITLEMICC